MSASLRVPAPSQKAGSAVGSSEGPGRRLALDAPGRLFRVGLGTILLAAALAPLVAVSLRDSNKISLGAGNPPAAPSHPPDRVVDREVAALLSGIPQRGNALGLPRAPVTLRVYTDLECLTARGWMVRLLPAIIRRFVRTGELRIEFASFKTDTQDARTFVSQQTAAIAAGDQRKMWNFVETFYFEQGREYTHYATERYLAGIAHQVPGLEVRRWQQGRRKAEPAEMVARDDKLVRELGYHSTPAFAIGPTGGLMKKLTGRHIVLEFPHSTLLRYPVTLIDARDLQKAIGPIMRLPHV